jgi:hypothetical protein
MQPPIDLVQSIGISIQEANTARVEQDEPASAIRLLVYAEARLNDLVNGIVKNDISAELWGGVYRALRIAFERLRSRAGRGPRGYGPPGERPAARLRRGSPQGGRPLSHQRPTSHGARNML